MIALLREAKSGWEKLSSEPNSAIFTHSWCVFKFLFCFIFISSRRTLSDASHFDVLSRLRLQESCYLGYLRILQSSTSAPIALSVKCSVSSFFFLHSSKYQISENKTLDAIELKPICHRLNFFLLIKRLNSFICITGWVCSVQSGEWCRNQPMETFNNKRL